MLFVKQQGFSVIHIVLTMAFLTFLAIQALPMLALYQRHMGIAIAKISMETLAQAATAYRGAEGEDYYGTWPTYAELVAEDFGITTVEAVNFRGNLYTFDTLGTALRISTELGNDGEARDLAAQWGVAGGLTGSVARLVIPIPGQETSHDELVPTDGSRAMEGNLDMDGNDIMNVDNLSATASFMDTVVVGETIQVTNADNTGSLTANTISADVIITTEFIYSP